MYIHIYEDIALVIVLTSQRFVFNESIAKMGEMKPYWLALLLLLLVFSVTGSNSFRVTVQRQLIFPLLDTEQGRQKYTIYKHIHIYMHDSNCTHA